MPSVAVTLVAALSIGSSRAFHTADVNLWNGCTYYGSNRLVRMPRRRRDSGVAFSQSDHVNGDGESNAEGEALAKEFYDLIRNRNPVDADEEREKEEYRRLYQQQLGEGRDDEDQPPQLLPEDEARSRNRDPFYRRESRRSKYDIPGHLSAGSSKSRRQFTGATPRVDSTGTPSAGLFSGEGNSVYSYPAGPGPSSFSNGPRRLPSDAQRSQIARQEFGLLGRATGDRAFFAQATIIVLMMALYTFIGMSGGITDGGDRFVEPSKFNPLGEAMDSVMDSITVENWSVVVPKLEGLVWL